MVDGPPKEFF